MNKIEFYMTTEDAAKYFDVSSNMIYYFIQNGWVNSEKILGRRLLDAQQIRHIAEEGAKQFPYLRKSQWPRMVWKAEHMKEVNM